MILTCSFDLSAFSDIFGVSIGTINLLFVIAFAIIEARRIRKIEKHHDIVGWYETFRLRDDIHSFVEDAETLRMSMFDLVNITPKQKLNANKAVDINDAFVRRLYFFKNKFLDIVEVMDQKRVKEFLDNINEVEDFSIYLLNCLIGLKSKEERIISINDVTSSIKRKIIKIGFDLSTF